MLSDAFRRRFEIRRKLGAGGMGEVFLAREVPLDRSVAVKVIRPGNLVHAEARARFIQEARITARLSHPGIVRVYDQGEDEGGGLYIVFELVEGGDLDRLLRGKPRLPPADFFRLAGSILDAVAHAHDQGVLHRDLKPANVLLDGAGEPRISDFGLATCGAAPGLKTRTGVIMGTPRYMAPELCQGQRATPASDQYALGAILYEMLGGRPPFDGPVLELLNAHVRCRPPSLVDLRPEVPPELEATILRALEKVPDRRWASVRELLEHLRGLEQSAGESGWCRQPGRKVLPVTLGPLEPVAGTLAASATSRLSREGRAAPQAYPRHGPIVLVAAVSLAILGFRGVRRSGPRIEPLGSSPAADAGRPQDQAALGDITRELADHRCPGGSPDRACSREQEVYRRFSAEFQRRYGENVSFRDRFEADAEVMSQLALDSGVDRILRRNRTTRFRSLLQRAAHLLDRSDDVDEKAAFMDQIHEIVDLETYCRLAKIAHSIEGLRFYHGASPAGIPYGERRYLPGHGDYSRELWSCRILVGEEKVAAAGLFDASSQEAGRPTSSFWSGSVDGWIRSQLLSEPAPTGITVTDLTTVLGEDQYRSMVQGGGWYLVAQDFSRGNQAFLSAGYRYSKPVELAGWPGSLAGPLLESRHAEVLIDMEASPRVHVHLELGTSDRLCFRLPPDEEREPQSWQSRHILACRVESRWLARVRPGKVRLVVRSYPVEYRIREASEIRRADTWCAKVYRVGLRALP